MASPTAATPQGTRLATSGSVDSFLSWISTPSVSVVDSSRSKSRKLRASVRPPMTTLPSDSSDSTAASSSSSQSTKDAAAAASGDSDPAQPRDRTRSGSSFILADATRLRELSRSPLEEMGLPLFGASPLAASSSASSSRSSSAASKKKSAVSVAGSNASSAHKKRHPKPEMAMPGLPEEFVVSKAPDAGASEPHASASSA